MPASHRFLRWILPAKAFAAVREGTKRWLLECPCGFRRDLWDAGGVRYMAAGEPRRLAWCPGCRKATWHRLRKKTETEQREMP